MSQIHGHKQEAGSTRDWHPIHAEEFTEGVYALLVTSAGTSGSIEQQSGTANLLEDTVNFSSTTKHLKIQNTDATNDILVSFDGGTNFYTIPAGETLELDAQITSLIIKASVDGTPYEILAIV